MTFTSYAQNFEDVYIWRAFREDTPFGFYIDVGAYDPIDDSVTQFLYERGWSGVNVEPGPSIERFAVRTRDLNLSLAVTDQTGFSSFYLHSGDPGTSTTMPAVTPELEGRVGERIKSRVATVTLEHLFDRYAKGRHVHVLKLDIEGMEGPVIATTDWKRYRPELILVEVTQPYTNERRGDEMLRPLLEAGYEEVFFDGVNAYFLREESLFRRGAFDRPVNVLDGFRKRDAEREHLARLIAQADEQRDAAVAAERSRLEEIVAHVRLEIEEVRARLSQTDQEHEAALAAERSRLDEIVALARTETEVTRAELAQTNRALQAEAARASAKAAEAERLAEDAAELRAENATLAERVDLLEGALDHARLNRDVAINAAQELARRDSERWEAEAHKNHGLHAGAVDELEASRARETALAAALEAVRAELDTTRASLQTCNGTLASQAGSLRDLERWRDDLVFRLQAPGGPRALAAVLPLARALRAMTGARSR